MPERTPYRDLALMLLASRGALLLVGTLAASLLGSGLAVQRGNLVYHEAAWLPLEIWARWDSEWYLLIASEGYAATDRFEGLAVNYEPEAAAGFLPLYPLIIRALSPVTGGVGAGVLISGVCLAGSLVLLYRLVRHESPAAPLGHRAGLAACAALLVYPHSLFLSAVYPESLFLLLSLALFAFARGGRFALAGAAGALASLTRPFGVLLVLPMLAEWWAQRHGRPEGRGRPGGWAWAWTLAIPAALAGFMIYCGRLFGDPMALFHRQERWRGAMSGPWRAFARWWEAGPAPHGAHGSTLELITALALLAMVPAMIRRLRASYALYATITLLLPLCSTLWSYGRLACTVFPAFMLIGVTAAEGRARLPLAYAVAASTLSGLLMALYASWWWAG